MAKKPAGNEVGQGPAKHQRMAKKPAGNKVEPPWLMYKAVQGTEKLSTKDHWLAKPFMYDQVVQPGPSYYAGGFSGQLCEPFEKYITVWMTPAIAKEWA